MIYLKVSLMEKRTFQTFPKIPFEETMLKYGTDKPDLRNPILIKDVSKLFTSKEVSLKIFKDNIKNGGIVKVYCNKKH